MSASELNPTEVHHSGLLSDKVSRWNCFSWGWKRHHFILQGRNLYAYELNAAEPSKIGLYKLTECDTMTNPSVHQLLLKFRRCRLYLKSESPATIAGWQAALARVIGKTPVELQKTSKASKIIPPPSSPVLGAVVPPKPKVPPPPPVPTHFHPPSVSSTSFRPPTTSTPLRSPLKFPSKSSHSAAQKKQKPLKRLDRTRPIGKPIGLLQPKGDWQDYSQRLREQKEPHFYRYSIPPAKLRAPVAGWVKDPNNPGLYMAKPQDQED